MVCKPVNCEFQEAFPYKIENKHTLLLLQEKKNTVQEER